MAKRSPTDKTEDKAALPAQEKQGLPADDAAPDTSGKNPAAVQLGRLGGKKGGPARARKLTKEQRVQIARKAAQTRWAKRRHS
jgi:hypothetical protein